jgi:glutamate-1-semialdehyde 2,1-aminomutase
MDYKREGGSIEQASRWLVSGVSAGGRFFQAIGKPLLVSRANGAYLYTDDGTRYIDFHTSSGAALLGHNHPGIAEAIRKTLEMGYFCNHDTVHHYKLAEKICKAIPCAEKVRFTNSGTEATMAALRLARAVTGRKKILKFEGHFHGMHELTYFNCHTKLPEPDRNGEIQIIPDSAGIPEDYASTLIVIPFNDEDIFRSCLRRHRGELAAVILEPVMYNAGCILAKKEFLQLVRKETAKDEIVLIFDEVLSGFRMCLGGAQEYYGIVPDLATVAKALGGSGIPIAALVGKDYVMNGLNPSGKTIVSGTYSGHLLAVMSSIEALDVMSAPGFYNRINSLSERLYNGLDEIFQRYHIKAIVQGLGARFAFYFGIDHKPLYNYREVARSYDFEQNRKFVSEAFRKKLYFHDFANRLTPTHHGFSAAHSIDDIDECLQKCEDIIKAFSRER